MFNGKRKHGKHPCFFQANACEHLSRKKPKFTLVTPFSFTFPYRGTHLYWIFSLNTMSGSAWPRGKEFMAENDCGGVSVIEPCFLSPSEFSEAEKQKVSGPSSCVCQLDIG